jgi:hypothetical protein
LKSNVHSLKAMYDIEDERENEEEEEEARKLARRE